MRSLPGNCCYDCFGGWPQQFERRAASETQTNTQTSKHERACNRSSTDQHATHLSRELQPLQNDLHVEFSKNPGHETRPLGALGSPWEEVPGSPWETYGTLKSVCAAKTLATKQYHWGPWEPSGRGPREPLDEVEIVCFSLKIHKNCIFQEALGPGVPQTILITILWRSVALGSPWEP